ncbi:MAG TPA: TonB-dependent receptor plug domain-containing protein [Candidatus Eisenbacteria bacterium]|nr:TonB-dependent receptor plug domain-containing protein [Candidatus Eisenbacteria bacterium]
MAKFKKIALTLLVASFFPSAAAVQAANDLTKLSIQQLMDMEIISVSKSSQPLSQSAAAVFVLSGEDLRRSGATNIPEALRMVPGLDVARVSSSQWAIASRGSAGILSNKLLVLIDGRSVYTPLYAGVYWDSQDTLMEDIDRIEVIRGPGATIWGANAVNGVINIITRTAKETQGGLVKAGAGTEERFFGGLRYGGTAGEGTYYRVYGKYFDRDESFNGNDQWRQGRGGFRIDRETERENSYTLQGDYYNGEDDLRGTESAAAAPFTQRFLGHESIGGGNVLWRWNHVDDERRDSALQVYFDETHRGQRVFDQNEYALDFDWRKRFPLADIHEVTWGLGYRFLADETSGSFSVAFDPPHRQDNLFSSFLQDEITLVDEKAWLTLGTKLEHNDYSGFELEPSARLAVRFAPRQTVWTSVSRAVRTPSRFEHNLAIAGWVSDGVTLARIYGDSGVPSEDVVAYELGYRVQPTDALSFDAATFYNVYDNLGTISTGDPFAESTYTVTPYFIDNNMRGDTYGFELGSQFQAASNWKINTAYTFLEQQYHSENDPLGLEGRTEGSSPRNQVSIRSLLDLPCQMEFDSQLRYVDSLVSLNTDSYVELDLRLAWHPAKNCEISIVGQNLLDNHHVEFASKSDPTAPQVERSVYAKVVWTF